MKKLEVKYTTNYEDRHDTLSVYTLNVEVTGSVNMTDKIFVFQYGGDAGDFFIKVATPIDLEEIPEDNANLEEEIPFYRLSSVSLEFESIEILQDTKKFIEQDINTLVRGVNSIDNSIYQEETKTYDGSTPIDFY